MMDEESKEVLRRIKENDYNTTRLHIMDEADVFHQEELVFNSSKSSDFTKLGQYIATNTHLHNLEINIHSVANINIRMGFYNGLRRNSTIQKLLLRCDNNDNVLGDIGNETLRAYQDNSSHLTQLKILQANLLQNEVEHVALTLRSCTSLNEITLYQCNITGQKLVSIVEALRGQTSLEKLYLNDNSIGNEGCEALALLFQDRYTNLKEVQLSENNNIGNEGTITIVNNLANNTKLEHLWLTDNPFDHTVEIFFSKLLCNTTSVNSIYSSNHTLRDIYFGRRLNDSMRLGLLQLLGINGKINKSHVAMEKILKYNPLDMAQLYGWDSEDERTLKALPFVLEWFERARKAVRTPQRRCLGQPGRSYPSDEGRFHKINERKLSAIYQFAKAMPLLFIPSSHINGSSQHRRSKRKRVSS